MNTNDTESYGNSNTATEDLGKNPEDKPKNYALLSVMSLLSFIPLGLLSQYYAFKVDGLYYKGEIVKARKASKKALLYGILGVAMGFVITGLLLFGIIWLVITLYEAVTTIGSTGLVLDIMKDFIPINPSDSLITEGDSGVGSIFEYSPDTNSDLTELLNQLNQNPDLLLR